MNHTLEVFNIMMRHLQGGSAWAWYVVADAGWAGLRGGPPPAEQTAGAADRRWTSSPGSSTPDQRNEFLLLLAEQVRTYFVKMANILIK
jgi:hypothetical protein